MKRIVLSLGICLFSLLVKGQIIKGCLISIENNKAYLDVTAPAVQVGDVLSIYTDGGYIVHPITKKKIKKEGTILADLEIVEVKTEYSIATIFPEEALSKIKVGMFAQMPAIVPKMRQETENVILSELEKDEQPQEISDFSTVDNVLKWHLVSTGLSKLENIPFESYLIETSTIQKNGKGKIRSVIHLTKIADVMTKSVYIKSEIKTGMINLLSTVVINNGTLGWIKIGKKTKPIKQKLIPLYLSRINCKEELLCSNAIYSRSLCGEQFVDGKLCVGIEFVDWKTGKAVRSYFDKSNGFLVIKYEKDDKGKELKTKVIAYKTFFSNISLPSIVQVEDDKGNITTIETLRFIPDYEVNRFQFSKESLQRF